MVHKVSQPCLYKSPAGKGRQDTRQESLHFPPPSGAMGREAFPELSPGPLGSFCNAAPNFIILFWKATKNNLVIPRGASGSSLRQQQCGAALPGPSGSFGRGLSACAVPACSLPSSGHQPCWWSRGGWLQGLLHLTLSVSHGCNTEQSWRPDELLSSEAWCSLCKGPCSFSQPFLQLGAPLTGCPQAHAAAQCKHTSNTDQILLSSQLSYRAEPRVQSKGTS